MPYNFWTNSTANYVLLCNTVVVFGLISSKYYDIFLPSKSSKLISIGFMNAAFCHFEPNIEPHLSTK